MSEAFMAGLAGGVMAGQDSRRGVRRLVALAFALVALIALAVTAAMQLLGQNGQGLPVYVVGTLFWAFVVACSAMKWTTLTPVSAAKILPRAILAARQGTPGKVWGIGAFVAWILAIVAGATMSTGFTVAALLILVVFAWGMGVEAGKAGSRVRQWMEGVRDLVARAIPCDPSQLSGGNSGDLRRPEITLEYPALLSSEHNAEVIDRIGYLGQGTGLAIVGVAPEGITLCRAKDLAYHQDRVRK